VENCISNNNAVAVIVGDLHLADRTWVSRRDITGDAICAFSQAVAIAIQLQLPLVLLGDIFDSRSVPSTVVQVFCQKMDELQSHNIAVYFIQGNHDYCATPWPSVHAWPIWLHEKVHYLPTQDGQQQVACYGLDYQPLPVFKQSLAHIPAEAQILFTHQAWAEFGKMGSSETAEASWLPRAIAVASGDLHMVLASTGSAADGGAVSLLSPGAVCVNAVNEPSNHFVFTLHTTMSPTGQSLTYTGIPLLSRPVQRYVLQNEEELASLVPMIRRAGELTSPHNPQDIRQPIVSVAYNDSMSGNVFVVLQAAAKAAGVHLIASRTAGDAVLTQFREAAATAVAASELVTLEAAVGMVENVSEEAKVVALLLIESAKGSGPAVLSEFVQKYKTGSSSRAVDTIGSV